jgi:endonuclease/exonuclease/phosphatase family metal-dependent hydrolase
MSENMPFWWVPCRPGLLALIAVLGTLLAVPQLCAQSTGTFLDRQAPSDLRVISYNVLWDSIFPEINATQAAKFRRVVQALNPDILNLQEIDSPFDPTTTFTAADVANLMDSIMPLPGGAQWYAHKGGDNVMVSKYPLSLQRTNTRPASPRDIAIALVDLPDEQFTTDFYFMNNHFRCCGDPGGSEDADRQQQADALVNWMRDARSPGGIVNLAAGTPMAVVGDLNIVGLPDPLNNLISGNIVNEATYGADSPPDWDGTALADAHPVHNGSGGTDYTWRNDYSQYAPGRLDHVLYTDSVARAANQFVLNTVSMSAAERAAAGLQAYDVTIDALDYDHLPLVVDFRFLADGSPGDFNLDRTVDAFDYDLWRKSFGSTAGLAADANGDQIVDAADVVIWRKYATAGGGSEAAVYSVASVPEPASDLLILMGCGTWAATRRRLSRPVLFPAVRNT